MAPWHLQRRGLPAHVTLQRKGRCESPAADTRSRQKMGALAQKRGRGLGGDTGSVSRSSHRPRTARGGLAPSFILFLFSKHLARRARFLEPYTFKSAQQPMRQALFLPLLSTAVAGSLPPPRAPRPTEPPAPASHPHPSCSPAPPALTASAWQILLPALN